MNRIWLTNYPQGTPAEIDPDRYASILDLLDKTFAGFGDKPAFHNLGCSMSYAELDRKSRAFAAFLQGLPGMVKVEQMARVGSPLPSAIIRRRKRCGTGGVGNR